MSKLNASGPINLSGMRRVNTAATLRALHADRVLTLRQLSDATGLSRRTVELIVEGLIADGWVDERRPSDDAHAGAGRPARRFAFNPGKVLGVAVEIGPSHCDVHVADLYGTMLGTWSAPLAAGARRGERLANVRSAVLAMFEAYGLDRAAVGAATIATVGVVRDDGTVELSWSETMSDAPGIPDWSGFSLADELDGLFDVRMHVENDAKLAAVGEGWRGSATGVEDYAYLLHDSYGVGLGIVIGGAVYRGSQGAAGELFRAMPAFRLGPGYSANPLKFIGAPHTEQGRAGLEIVANARGGAQDARQLVSDLARELAPGLHAIAVLLAPVLLVLGGALTDIGDLLIPELEEEFARLPPTETRLAASQLGTKAVSLGALRASLDRIEADLFAPNSAA